MKIALILFFTIIMVNLRAQTSIEQTKNTLSKYVVYWGLKEKVPADTLQKWTTWLITGENEKENQQTRINAYSKLYMSIFTAVGDQNTALKDALRTGQISGVPGTATEKLSWPDETKTTPVNEVSKVIIKGSGPTSIIIIPTPGFDNTAFNALMDAGSKEFTFYFITIPGTDGTPPYKLPEVRNLKGTAWLNNVANAVIKEMAKRKINQAYLLTQGSSINTAMKINELAPKKIKGIINLNGNNLVATPSMILFGQPNTPQAPIDPDKSFPISDLQRPKSTSTVRRSYQNNFSLNRKLAIELVEDMGSRTNTFATSRFFQETRAVSTADELKKQRIPILEILPYHDELSIAITNNRSVIQSWVKFKWENPDVPVTVITMRGRGLFFIDNPTEVIENMRKFVAGKLAEPDLAPPPTRIVNPSPGAEIAQTFSNTDVRVLYHRPAAKEREIFGKLVPYGKVWRAGANDATTISFSRNVIINGKKLERGVYSLFILPEETKWTFIFNKMLNQWGAFSYDQQFDVMRVEAPVKMNDKQEWLKYDFENLTSIAVDLTLQWAESKASLTIQEDFQLPIVPEKIKSVAWTKILEDEEKDCANLKAGRPTGATADGKSLSYFFDKQSDMIWFKLETYTDTDTFSPAMSISLDTDFDQQTGAPWYGSNTKFTVDKMISAGPKRQGDGYEGFNGITDEKGIRLSEWTNVLEDNVSFYFSPDEKCQYLGFKVSDIKPGMKKFNVIGSVGNNSIWNDDIGKDGTFATIELK